MEVEGGSTEKDLERRSNFLSSLIKKKKATEQEEQHDRLNVRVRASDMSISLQNRAFSCARDNLDSMSGKLDNKSLALALKKEAHHFRNKSLIKVRNKIWWVIPRVGKSGSDIPVETQMLLLESTSQEDGEEPNYIVFLPVLDGDLRSSLQGNSANELEVCVETGDPSIVASESLKAVFVNYGSNPFDLMKELMKILEEHLGTFTVREGKQLPGMLDWFGWCTWDAFYQAVSPPGIRDGLKSLSEGGTPPRFLLIDDGWLCSH